MAIGDPQYISTVLQLLKKHYPNAKIVLNFSNNFELLVAVMLSAQTTDVAVNKVTAILFPKYSRLEGRTLNRGLRTSRNKVRPYQHKSKIKNITRELQEIINFAEVDVDELANDIRSIGLYHNKAKNIKATARLLLEKFDGKVSRTMEGLLTLPGVARKTANIVLSNAYNIVSGIAVDTHVFRVSKRLDLTNGNNPVNVEQDLMQVIPKEDWLKVTYLLIEHGRAICKAPLPKCDQCFLNKLCPSAFNFPNFQKPNQA